MEPIINPWFFYIAGVADKLEYYSSKVMLMSFLSIVLFVSLVFLTEVDLEEFLKTFKKPLKFIFVLFIISSLLFVIVPSKETLYRTQMSKFVTQDNFDKGIKHIEKITENELKREKSNGKQIQKRIRQANPQYV